MFAYDNSDPDGDTVTITAVNNQPVPAGIAGFNGEIPFEDDLPFAASRQGQFIDFYVWADGSWAWQVRNGAPELIAAIEAAGEALTKSFRIEVTDGRGGYSTFGSTST